MNSVLYALCRYSTDIMSGWIPVPAHIIAESTGVSLYKARKELRLLKENGLACTFSTCIDPEESSLPYHGWGITKAAYKTEEYRIAAQKEAELCEECFDIPKEQMLNVLLKEAVDE